MNLEKLRDNYPNLINFMEEKEYSKSYIQKVQSKINIILANANKKGWKTYYDVYIYYVNKDSSKRNLQHCANIIGLIEQFDKYDRLPNGTRRHELWERNSYALLVPEFKSLIDYYSKLAVKQGKKETTIYDETCNASKFLLCFQEKGISSLKDITEEMVLSMFFSINREQLLSCSYKKQLLAVFKAGLEIYPTECKRIILFLPRINSRRKNIQYLTDNEIKQIKETLNNSNNQITLRDKAIVMLLIYTGLRACDITGLELNSIDWENDIIKITQQKTEVPLELPLTTIVGNAIYDYIISERIDTNSPILFLSQTKPHGKIQAASLGNVVTKVMKVANIRQGKGERKGTHLFRHKLVSTLIGNNVPQPVVSQIIGHIAPKSLDTYLSADFVHLKECSISITQFPVGKGAFNYD